MATGAVRPSAWSSLQDTRGQLPGSVVAPCPPPSVLNQVQGSSCCSPHPFLFQTRDYWFSSQVMLLLRTQNCHLYLSPSTARTPPVWLSLHIDTSSYTVLWSSTRRLCVYRAPELHQETAFTVLWSSVRRQRLPCSGAPSGDSVRFDLFTVLLFSDF